MQTTQFSQQYLIEIWSELIEFLMQHPDKLMENQLSSWQSHSKLYQEFMHDSEETSDKRFRDEIWRKNLIFDFIRRSYLLTSQHVDNLSAALHLNDEKQAKKFRFFSRQFIDSLAPSNFIHTNPEILHSLLETNGDNLINGFKQLQEDLQQGKSIFLNHADLNAFTLGENIACTSGSVIYQNDLMQLIQYTPVTEKIYQYPLLIIPPWVNKYYILDLQPDNSLTKWLVDQGHVVFMISWVNPHELHRNKEFIDYMLEGPLVATKIIRSVMKTRKINLLGYCVGGTLLACLLAYLHKKGKAKMIQSATFLTTLLDFSEPGELGVFMDEKQICLLEKHMQEQGYVDGKLLASIFNILRANDLIWTSFVNHYLKGQKPKPFDLLYWNADSTNVPEKVHRYYLRNMYLNNLLVKPNALKFKRTPLDLNQITTPSYFLAAEDDHIIPWQSSFQSQMKLNCPSKFVLTASGHVAGVVNPPNKHKYGYWVNSQKTFTPENFLATAAYYPGSWWSDWIEWLTRYSGGKMNSNKLVPIEAIEEAPGSYVKVRFN